MRKKSKIHKILSSSKTRSILLSHRFQTVKEFVEKNFYSILLVSLIIGISISHILYVIKTYQYPQWDEHPYLDYAVNVLPLIKHPTISIWNDILHITKFRQPLYSVIIAIVLSIFGTIHAYKTILILNGIFYSLTIIGTYFLAKHFMNRFLSLLAAYSFAFYGFPLFYLHFTVSETATTTFIILSLLFLMKSDIFKKNIYTILFSIFASFSLLVRWESIIFLIGPSLWIFLFYIKFVLKQNKLNVIRIVSTVKPMLLIIFFFVIPTLLLYYVPNFNYFKQYVEENRMYGPIWAPGSIKNPFSPSSLIWYSNVLAQQTIFFWLLFIAGFLLSVSKIRKNGFLVITFLTPYIVLTIGGVWKDDRFIVPIYPYMAILSITCIDMIKLKKIKYLLIGSVIVIGFLNFLGASWGIGPMKFSVTGNRTTVPHSILVPMPIGHPRRVWFAPISWPPRENEGNSDLILKTILEDNKNEKRPNVLLTFSIPQIEGPLYKTVLYEQRDIIDLRALWGFNADDYEILFNRIKNADYILIKEEGAFDDQFDGKLDLLQTFNETIRSSNVRLPMAYQKLKEVNIPFDESRVYIYKRIRSLSQEDIETFEEIF
ncbi:MAG: hypothetical protein HYT08_01355 [Candidatus Levybacteria bacterium]|nr:hypothetical protein [Candidatus Levybacteria bacterium]